MKVKTLKLRDLLELYPGSQLIETHINKELPHFSKNIQKEIYIYRSKRSSLLKTTKDNAQKES